MPGRTCGLLSCGSSPVLLAFSRVCADQFQVKASGGPYAGLCCALPCNLPSLELWKLSGRSEAAVSWCLVCVPSPRALIRASCCLVPENCCFINGFLVWCVNCEGLLPYRLETEVAHLPSVASETITLPFGFGVRFLQPSSS